MTMISLITNILRQAFSPPPLLPGPEKHSLRSRIKNFFTLKTLFGYPPPPLDPSRETAWLDGLRGVAAFLVMTYHFHLTFWMPFYLETPFGGYEVKEGKKLGDPHMELWRLPFIRLWMGSGHAQVSVFFVLSGFVLSWGPLQKIQRGDLEKFAEGLGSATLRRWIRLFLPCFAVAFWECLELYFGFRTMPKEPKSNLFAQIWEYVGEQAEFANPFNVNRTPYNSLNAYDFTMWTIPYEWAGSLLVFLVLLAVCRVKSFLRRTMVLLVVAVWACVRAEWNFFLFGTGMVVASYVRFMGGFKNVGQRRWRSGIAWTGGLILSLLMAGIPEDSVFFTRPGYDWTRALTPERWMEHEGGVRFWWCWAGILFITSACHLPRVQRFFELGLMRYLGRISYMLYLTHRVVLNLLGAPLEGAIVAFFGRKEWIDGNRSGDPFGTLIIYLILMGVLLPIAILVAHWCEMLIDAPSTRFARSVDRWFTMEFDAGSPAGATEMARQEEQIELLPRDDSTLEQGEMAEEVRPP
ncbi:acyltransferase, class 3 [Lecanosticta acicola]|uniref:Acyltransferase, class 3 n=1 Tax=Lecanosticta acicola TaxID=111012 RepID=A0AAI8Z3Y0_9PEZI|nr:acyltransferase, class 3 [Lecanosticta acicola]